MTAQQISSLTPMRGVAAILVVLHNFDSNGFFLNLASADYNQFFTKGYLWVDFFFLLSGFIMAHVYGPAFSQKYDRADYKEFILARFARIYPLHVLMLSLLVVLSLVKLAAITWLGFNANHPPFDGDSLWTLASNLLLLQGMNIHDATSWNIPSWSISVEWYTYMVFPFFAGFILKARSTRNALLFIVMLISLGAFIHFNNGVLAATAQGGFLRCIISFVIGGTIYHAFKSGLLQRFFRHDAVYLLSLFGAFALMYFGAYDLVTMVFMIFLLASTACNTGRVSKVLNGRPLAYLGEISYTIYLTHMVVKEWFLATWSALMPTEFSANMAPLASAVTMLAFCLLVIGISALVYKYFEHPARYIVRNSKLGRKFLGTA